jgi:hypothetical protein
MLGATVTVTVTVMVVLAVSGASGHRLGRRENGSIVCDSGGGWCCRHWVLR